MKFTETFRYAASELWSRRAPTLLTALAVFFSALAPLVLGYYGRGIHEHQKRSLDETTNRRVTADCPSVSAAELRFGEEKIAEVSRWPGVELAFRRVEIGVNLHADGGGGVHVPAEGTVPGDPLLAPARLAWGTDISSREAHEIVLGERLFTTLGGAITETGPRPPALRVEVRRKFQGDSQSREVELRVAGIARFHESDRVYLPLEVIEDLDEWCTGKRRELPWDQDAGHGALHYPALTVYVEKANEHRLAADAEQLRIAVEKTGRVTLLEPEEDIWTSLRARPGEAFDATVLEDLAGSGIVAVEEVDFAIGRERVRLAALALGDPRWALVPGGAPAVGSVISASPGRPPVLRTGTADVRVVTTIHGFPGGAELYCIPQTLGWLRFDPATAAACRDHTWLRTRSRDVALRLQRVLYPLVEADVDQAWAVFRVEPKSAPEATEAAGAGEDQSAAAAMGLVERLSSASTRWRCDAMRSSIVVVETQGAQHASPAGFAAVVARAIPAPLFWRLAAGAMHSPAGAGSIPCIEVVPPGGPAVSPGGGSLAGLRLETVGRLPGTVQEVWIPDKAAGLALRLGRLDGVAVWSDGWELPDVLTQAGLDGLRAARIAGHEPSRFDILLPGHAGLWARLLEGVEEAVEARRIRAIDVELAVGGSRLPVTCAAGRGVTPGTARLRGAGETTASARTGVLRVPGGFQLELALVRSHEVPAGLVLVDSTTFRRLVWESGGKDEDSVPEAPGRLDVMVPDVFALGRLRARCREAGLEITPLVPVRERRLVRYRVTDRQAPRGEVSETLASMVASARASVAAAVPWLSTEADVEGKKVAVQGTLSSDPQRFASGLLAGRWLEEDGRAAVVLPGKLFRELFLHGPLAASVGGEVALRFMRPARVSNAEPGITLFLKVAGFSGDDRAYVHMDTLRSIERWRRGEVVYSEARRTFEDPAAVQRRAGGMRCTFYARDRESIGPLVARLQHEGYRTEHALEEIERVERTGRTLYFLVACLASVGVLFGLVMSWTVTHLEAEHKRHEIGVLRALGLPRRGVLWIFGVQALLLSGIAGLSAAGVASLLEPLASPLVASLLGARCQSLLPERLASPTSLPLFLTAFGVSAGSCLLGVGMAGWSACRRPVRSVLCKRA